MTMLERTNTVPGVGRPMFDQVGAPTGRSFVRSTLGETTVPDDLFDGVKIPKERREPQAAAEAPPQPSRASSEKRSGVPVARLLGWAVPLLAVVAVIVLWSVSVWLLIAAAIAAAVGGIATLIGWLWRRRTGRRHALQAGRGTTATSWPGRARSGSRWNPGNWRTGRRPGGRGSAGRSGSGRQSAGRSRTGRGLTGGRVSGAGRGTTGRSGRGKRGHRSAGTDGPARRGIRSWAKPSGARTGRSPRNASPRQGSPSAARTGPASGRWARSRANPATWIGPRHAAAKALRKAERPEPAKRRSSSARRKTDRRDEKPQARRRWRILRKKAPTADTAKSTTDNNKGSGEGEQAKSQDKKPPKKNAKKETGRRARKRVDDIEVDDTGWPIFRPDQIPPPKPEATPSRPKPPVTTAPRRTNMSDRTANPYASMIDASSKESFRATCTQAATAARADAARLDEEASDLRRQAAGWQQKELDDVAEPLLREAAQLEETAGLRRQAAAAYDANAGNNSNSSAASGAV